LDDVATVVVGGVDEEMAACVVCDSPNSGCSGWGVVGGRCSSKAGEGCDEEGGKDVEEDVMTSSIIILPCVATSSVDIFSTSS